MSEFCVRTGKKCLSQREAHNIISFYKTGHKWHHRGKNIPKRSYYCEYCNAYHLTHFRN